LEAVMLVNQVWKRTMVGLAALLAYAGAAQAQVNPESGDVGGSGGAHFGATVEGSGSAGTSGSTTSTMPSSTTTPTDTSVSNATAPASPSDVHSMVVGHFGVGFFGVMDLPIMGCGAGLPCTPDGGATLPAPSIGARYWMSDLLGIEAALGMHFRDTSAGIDTSAFGLALHGGVPLALAHTGNFVFEVVPQLNIGFTTGSFTPGGGGPSTDVSGFLIEAGAKVGAEIHFGFIGIPQLALQGTLGLMIRHESRSADLPTGAGGATTSVDASATDISTGVDGPPWAIFTGALTAIYYFGV
jgi:hypothetical protein